MLQNNLYENSIGMSYYYVTTEKDEITKGIADELITNAEDFVLKIKVVIRNLNNDSVEELRDEFKYF